MSSAVLMASRPVSLIAACSLNGVIGKGGKLPWSLPSDWSWFCTATRGQVLILGRKSFEELCEPLPHRHTIVVSPSRSHERQVHEGVPVVASLREAIALAQSSDVYPSVRRIFVGGGQQLYDEAIRDDLAESCFITRVHTTIDNGDAFLPQWTQRFPCLSYSATTRTGGVSISFGIWTKRAN